MKMTVLTPRTARRARKTLLATTALVAAAAALPAYAQTVPVRGGTIEGADLVTDYPGGTVVVSSSGNPVTITNVTIEANNLDGGSDAYVQNPGTVDQTIILAGSNSFTTTQAGGTGFRVGNNNAGLTVSMTGGTQSFSGRYGMYLTAHGALNLVNTGGTLNVSGVGLYGLYALTDAGIVNLDLGTVNITDAGGSGVYASGTTGASVATSGGSITADTGIFASSGGLTSIVSGSTISATTYGIQGSTTGTGHVEITSNAAITAGNIGIYLSNTNGDTGDFIRANANVSGTTYGIRTAGNRATNVTVAAAATVQGGSAGVYLGLGGGMVSNAGTITGAIGISSQFADTSIQNNGTIAGTTTYGVNMAGGTLTNNAGGTISGQTWAVSTGSPGDLSITNAGTITGGTSGAISASASGALTLNLAAGSTTTGRVAAGGATVAATIAGTLNGDFTAAGAGATTATLAATGSVNGNVTLSNYNDVFTTQGGAISGMLDGGASYDTLNLAGGSTSLNITGFEAINQQGGTNTLTGNFAGVSTFAVTGGTLSLSSPTALTTTLTLNGGTLRAATVGAFGSGQIQATTGTLQYGATGSYANAIQLMLNTGPAVRLEADAGVTATLTGNIIQQSGPGQSLVIGGLGTIALTGAGNWTNGTTIDSGATLITRPSTVAAGGITNNGTLVFDNSGNGAFNLTIAGTGNLVKRGSDSLTIAGTNTYTGTTTIEAGTLTIGSLNTIATSSAVALTGSTAVLNLGSSAEGAAINNLSGVAGSSVTLAGKSYTLANSANTVFAGNLSSAAPFDAMRRITKTGTGTLTLSGDTSGPQVGVAINQGAIALAGTASLANAQLVTVASGATFDISGITGATSSVRDINGAGAIVLGSKTLSVTAANYFGTSTPLTGTITGTGGFEIAGGAVAFGNAMAYSGTTIIRASGQLNLMYSASLLQSDVIVDGQLGITAPTTGIRSLSGAGQVYLATNTLEISNGGTYLGTIDNGSLRLTGGALAINGYASLNTLTLDGGDATIGTGGASDYFNANSIVLNNGTLTASRDNVTLSNVSGAGNLVSAGLTTLQDSSYTGTTTVQSGTLSLRLGSAISNSGAVTVNAPGTLELAYGSETIGSLFGDGAVNLNQYTLSVTDGGNFAGVMSGTGTGSQGIVGLIVESGQLTLTGDSTYTGDTHIESGGTLTLGDGGTSGSLGTGLIRVGPGGNLVVDRSDTLSIAALAGGGRFLQSGTGITQLDGNEGFYGDVLVTNGTLAVLGAYTLEQAHSVSLTTAGTLLDLSGASSSVGIGTLYGAAGSTVRYGDAGMRVIMANNQDFAGVFDDVSTATPAPQMLLTGAGQLTLSGQSNMRAVGVDGAYAILKLTGTGSLGTGTAVTIDNGGTLDLSSLTGTSYAIGDLAGNGGTVTLGATTLTITDGQSNSFAGAIHGTGGLHLTGGAIGLSGLNDYSGDTVIAAGASILLSGNGSLLNSKVVLNGSLDVANAATISELAGDGTVVLTSGTLYIDGNGGESAFTGIVTELDSANPRDLVINSGHQTVSQDWTYTGLTVLAGSAGMTIGDGSTHGSLASAVLLNGGTLTADRSDTMTIHGLFGSGTLLQAGAGETILAATSQVGPAFGGDVVIANGALTLADWNALSQASSVTLSGANAVLNTGSNLEIAQINNLSGVAGSTINIGRDILQVNNTQDTVFAGALHSVPDPSPFYVQGMIKSGTGTLTLTGQNTLVTAIVDEGTLAVSGSGAIGDVAYVWLRDGTLDLSGITNGATAFGTLNGDNSDAIVNLGATTLTLNGEPYGGEFSGVIQGSGGLIVKSWQLLEGVNTYSGDTVVDAGARLALAGMGSIANSALVVNGVFDLGSVYDSDNDVVPDVTIANLSGSGEVNLSDSTLVVGGNDQNASFSGTLSGGAGRVEKDGIGTWTLSGTNDLTDLFVFGGTVALAGNGSLGSNAVVDLFGDLDISGLTNGGTSIVDLGGFGSVNLGANTLTLTDGSASYGGVISGTGGFHVAGGYGTFSATQLYTGTTTIDAGATLYLVGFDGRLTGAVQVDGTLDVSLHAGAPFIGGLSGTGTVELRPDRDLTVNGGGSFSGSIHGGAGMVFAAGTSTLSGTNDYAGTTTIDTGATLVLSGAGTTGTGAVIANGAFDISGSSTGVNIANLAGSGTVALGANTLTLGSDNLDSLFGGVASGTGGLTKVGTGVLTLSGANTYSGLTQVAEGTLRLGAAGVLADDSTLEVRNGATLDMNGFDETVAAFTIQGNLTGAGTLTAALYNLLGGAIDHDLGAGAVYQLGGTTLLNGTSAGSAVHVNGGTLVLGADDRLADTATVTVLTGAALDLQGHSDTVGSLALAGTLDGTGTLTAATYTLDSALVNANLGTGTLIQHSGNSLLNGAAATSVVNITGGTLQLGASDRLADAAAVTVAAGTTLDLQGFNDTVGTLALAGTLSGTGKLTAATYTLDSATVDANLGTGTLVQHSGTSLLNGAAATGAVNLTGGTLQLGASDRLADTAAVNVATGTILNLQGFSDTVGTLALAGTLSGTGTLTAATYTLDGATVNANLGAGTLIQHSGTSLLNGTAATTTVNIDAGTLRLGASDRLADTAAVTVASGTTLDLQGFNDTVGTLALAGTLSGTGTLTAASYTLDGAAVNTNLGTGTLTQHSGTSLLNGTAATTTVNVTADTLRLGAANRLADTATVTMASGTTLDLQSFSDTVGTLALAGTLDGTGTLTASTYTLDSATVNANLGTGTLIQHSGTSLLNGTAATGTVHVDAGTLRLGAANRLADTAAVTVANGTTLDLQGFNDTVGTLALAGTLSGTGTLSAASYTLNGATVNANLGAGTLIQTGGASTLRGSFAGNAMQLNGGTLTLDRTGAITYAGTLSGTGALVQTGGGVLTLSGNSTGFAGTTTVSAGGLAVNGQLGGTVTVSAGALSGTGSIGGAVSLADGTHLVGANGATLSMGSLALSSGTAIDVTLSQPSTAALFTVAGNLTLDGTLNITAQPGFGAGIYRLISYGGTLTDNGLALGTVTGGTAAGLSVQTGNAGQVNLVNTNGATLAFWDGGVAANHDNGIVNGGVGTWSLGTRNWTDANGTINGPMQPVPSFAVFQGTGGTITIDNGAGQVAATGMQFASNGYTLSGGALALSGAQATVRVGDGTAAGANITATIASALTGSSALVKTDLGTLVLTGANSYTGGTIVQAGTLIGNAASLQGGIQNAGTVTFNQATNASFSGAISGTGSYVKSGAGALTLTGASSSTWQITAGSLISTSALFTGNADLGAGTSLVFDQAANGTYAGTLTGTGSVLFQGGGTVLLTGNSSGFLGTTSVAAGSMFSVNGTLGGMINVAAGGRLQGSGTAGSASVAGTIAPGNSIGTLTFTGNLALTSGSVFEVEANAAGQSDKIVVGGTASIASGTTVTVLAANGNYAANTSYTILTAAGGLSGTFTNVTSNLAFLTPTLAYSANAVTLNLKRNTVDFISVAQTGNQSALAPAVQALGAGNSVYEAVAVLTAPEARAAFDQLAGSDYASVRASLVEDSRFMRDAMLARDEMAGTEGLAMWGRVVGSWRDVDGTAEAQGYKRSTQGFITGFDGSFDGHWRMGVALSYGTGEFRTGNATHKAESYQAGTSLLGAYGPVSIQFGTAYGWNAINSQRHVAFGGLNQLLGDKYDARTFQAFGQLAVKGSIGGVDLKPFVSLAHVALFDATVNEHGGSAALHGGTDGFDATYGSIGLKGRVGWDLGGTKLSIDGSAAARRVFGDRVPTIDLAFAGGNTFQASGIPLDRTSAAVDLGLELDLSEHIRLGLSYTGTYADRSTDHGARAQLSWRF
ncbi:autotransporter-associated beta strand repeat-containing protein [Sphingomonas sp. KR3-1]|uniref:autotransporter-associated beta strand repeat-containing protein n=1 Tax=Sphingomonas sp. KR3-1 TaxID=3156611 RepID=UPI0032B4ED24